MAHLETDRVLFNNLVRFKPGSVRDSLRHGFRTTVGCGHIKHGTFNALSWKPNRNESSHIRAITIRIPGQLSSRIQTPLEDTLLIYPFFLGITRSGVTDGKYMINR